MEELTQDKVYQMSASELATNVVRLFDYKDPIKREIMSVCIEDRARQLNVLQSIKRVLKAANDADKRLAADYTAAHTTPGKPVLEYDAKGLPADTIDNYLMVVRNDDRFSTFRFNAFSFKPEVTERLKTRPWSNFDDSDALHYIEKAYRLYNREKYKHSMIILQNERSYHPIREYIDALVWDGTPRMEGFIHRWLRCEDTPYTREVSRLIFAGGIHRLYDPGCKFDSVPVLIGTNQGEGKSSFVRWIAIKDEWYGELTDLEGNKSIENIQGTWICELGELLALAKAREVEAIKSYISRQVDKYRIPYAERPETLPRQCVFIGTTNKERFLTDKTGNRRFLPVKVDVSGYDLFKYEQDCRADIIQCWAEAKAKYNDAQTSLVPNRALTDDIVEQQQLAEEDDWRDGLIAAYIEAKRAPAKVCTLELWREALKMGDLMKPSIVDSTSISLIMQKHTKWKRMTKPAYFPEYGSQRGWELPEDTQEELPF